jgi:hypothetical protein
MLSSKGAAWFTWQTARKEIFHIYMHFCVCNWFYKGNLKVSLFVLYKYSVGHGALFEAQGFR